MKTVQPLFVSAYLLEECGLAAFTRDLADAVDLVAGEAVPSVAAIERTRKLTAADPGRPRHRRQPGTATRYATREWFEEIADVRRDRQCGSPVVRESGGADGLGGSRRPC